MSFQVFKRGFHQKYIDIVNFHIDWNPYRCLVASVRREEVFSNKGTTTRNKRSNSPPRNVEKRLFINKHKQCVQTSYSNVIFLIIDKYTYRCTLHVPVYHTVANVIHSKARASIIIIKVANCNLLGSVVACTHFKAFTNHDFLLLDFPPCLREFPFSEDSC